MKKQLKANPYLVPMPVQMIATYNEDGTPNLMNAAWGGILDYDVLVLSLDESHKTSDNIIRNHAFTLSLATTSTIKECDYVGIVSEKKDPQKFAKTGFHVTKSVNVNAPIVDELPLCLECEVIKITNDELGFLVYARIKSVLADETVLNEKGMVDSDKLDAVAFDQIGSKYLSLGKEVGKAFKVGKELMK